MLQRSRVLTLILLLSAGLVPEARADILVRWDAERVPPRERLGISTLLIPASNAAAVAEALSRGYQVHLEVDAAALPAKWPAERPHGIVVTGEPSADQLRQLRQRVGGSASQVRVVDARGKWPHVRLNWVTRRNDVLQVSSRTAQPWLETNAALVRVGQAAEAGSTPLLSYAWQPITVSDMHAGPALENYLVAIAEAGSFGGDLVLPLHEGFQRGLLLGRPADWAAWREVRRYLEFYASNLPALYRPLAAVGVIAADPMRRFEILNLLLRHNLPFELLTPDALQGANLLALPLLVVAEPPSAAQAPRIAEFARTGGTVIFTAPQERLPWHEATAGKKTEQDVTYSVGEGLVIEPLEPVEDPNVFALQVRELLGREKRLVDIWNGITVMAAPYSDPDGQTVLLTVLNYAHEPLPVQLRIRGTYASAHFESPENGEAELLPLRHRDGHTEFILPALRVGGRVFLTRDAAFE